MGWVWNWYSNNQFKTPSPDPGSGIRCVSREGLGILLFSLLWKWSLRLIESITESGELELGFDCSKITMIMALISAMCFLAAFLCRKKSGSNDAWGGQTKEKGARLQGISYFCWRSQSRRPDSHQVPAHNQRDKIVSSHFQHCCSPSLPNNKMSLVLEAPCLSQLDVR